MTNETLPEQNDDTSDEATPRIWLCEYTTHAVVTLSEKEASEAREFGARVTRYAPAEDMSKPFAPAAPTGRRRIVRHSAEQPAHIEVRSGKLSVFVFGVLIRAARVQAGLLAAAQRMVDGINMNAAGVAEPPTPGSPAARFTRLMRELERRLPDPEPFSAKLPERRTLQALDSVLAARALAAQGRNGTGYLVRQSAFWHYVQLASAEAPKEHSDWARATGAELHAAVQRGDVDEQQLLEFLYRSQAFMSWEGADNADLLLTVLRSRPSFNS